jgi:hypothetical protein
MAQQKPCPERARVFITSEPAIFDETTEYVDDGKGGKKPESKTTTVREADTQLVIQVTDGGEPIREWLSKTKRLAADDKKELMRIYDKLVDSAVKELGGQS